MSGSCLWRLGGGWSRWNTGNVSKSGWEWGKKPFLRAAGCGGGTVRKKECVGSVWCHTDLMWWRVSSWPTLATGIFPTTEHHSQDIKWEKWWKGPITLQGGLGINQGVLSKSLVSRGVFPPPSLSLSHSNSHAVRGVCCPAGGPSVAASVAVPAATAGPAPDPGPCPGLSPDLIPDHPLPQSPTLPLGPGNPGTALTLCDLR